MDKDSQKIIRYHPVVGFHFKVTFGKEDGNSLDVNFQSVSGLEVSLDVETIKEGGENRFEHALPGRAKYSTLTLKRGILGVKQSKITNWCNSAFKNQRVKPMDLNVILLGDDHQALFTWDVYHAWPKSWKFSELNAEKGEVFLETLELEYNRFELKDAQPSDAGMPAS